MTSEDYLIIFVKNPELGKVKTRLAKSIGPEKALEVYEQLLRHTQRITVDLECDKGVFYSDYIDDGDIWSCFDYQKFIQDGVDLGERMLHSFALPFSRGYERVLIIGSDCYELTPEIIEKAFDALDNNQVVIGPAADGGYYLLGMKGFYHYLFADKEWSTENVLLDTLLELKTHNVSYELLETLSDVDYVEDLGKLNNIIDEM